MQEIRPEFLLATLALASIFAIGKWLHLPNTGSWRDWVSASAGASVAYIWIHVIPELNEKQQAFTRAGSVIFQPHNFVFTFAE